MKVFVTGASSFIGSAVVHELLSAGHEVTGLARSDESAKTIKDAGAHVLKGSLDDLDSLKKGAIENDGIIHLAFIHDFTQYAKSVEADKAAIKAMGEVLKGTGKPIVITAGSLGLEKENGFVTENTGSSGNMPRLSEELGLELAGEGINASVVRLPPSVHDKDDKAFIPAIINIARATGISAYVEDGSNRWPAVHRLDAALLFRLALEKGAKGKRYNAIGDEGISIRRIAEVIGEQLNLPVTSVSNDDAAKHFTWLSRFIVYDSPATADITKKQLSWQPTHIGLIEDMKENYF